jgi:DNA-binding SARP family transcriptional activator
VQIAVLRPTRVHDAGRPVPVGAPKHRALLAALALHGRRAVAADTLIDLLWGERAPAAAGATLQTYVAHLRRALEPERAARATPSVLVTAGQGYRLALPDDAVDVDRFTTLVERTHRELATPEVPPRPPDGLGADRLAALRDDLDTALRLWAGTP